MSGAITLYSSNELVLRRTFDGAYEFEAKGRGLMRAAELALNAFRPRRKPVEIRQGAWAKGEAIGLEFGIEGNGVYLDLGGHRLRALGVDDPLLVALRALGADLRVLRAAGAERVRQVGARYGRSAFAGPSLDPFEHWDQS